MGPRGRTCVGVVGGMLEWAHTDPHHKLGAPASGPLPDVYGSLQCTSSAAAPSCPLFSASASAASSTSSPRAVFTRKEPRGIALKAALPR